MSLADRLLKNYERDLTVYFQRQEFPVFVLMERLLKIVDKDGRCVPFELNFQQCQLYIAICEQKRAGKPVRQDILKARQIGFSTFIAGLFFIIAMYTPNIKVGVVADIEAHAKAIFAKYQFFYDHLDDNNPNKAIIDEYARTNNGKIHPLSYKPSLRAQRGQQLMHTAKGNSLLEVIVAGEASGRGSTYHLLHLSECAFFENLSVTLIGLLETVSSKNLSSMIFLETTANGFNDYKLRWDKDVLGKTSYNAFFCPWYVNPEYVDDEYQKYYITFGKEKELPLMEEWLYEKQQVHKLSNAQMKYYWDKYLDKGDKDAMLQEYPFSMIDAFLSSGNCIVDSEMIAKRKEEVIKEVLPNMKTGKFLYQKNYSLDGSQISVTNDEFKEFRNGAIRIFVEPDETHPYVVVCDPNEGGSDDSAIQVIDNYTGEQCAAMKTNEMTVDEVTFQLYLLGKMYNWALVSSENNRSSIILETLVKLNYPRVYLDQKRITEDYYQKIGRKYGHNINRGNRDRGIQMLQMYFRENPRNINDYETLSQLETFQRVEHVDKSGKKTYKVEASGSSHDDLIMAYIGYFIVRDQQSFVPMQNGQTNQKRKFASIEEAEAYYEEKMRNISAQKGALERFSGIRF